MSDRDLRLPGSRQFDVDLRLPEALLGDGKQFHADVHVTVSSSLLADSSSSISGITPYASARIFSGWIVGLLVPCSICILHALHSVVPNCTSGSRIALIRPQPARKLAR